MELTNAITKQDHIIGSKTAAIELLEYGDYECPSCGVAYQVVKQAIKALGTNMVFIFRNFPLTDIHPEAFDAALAAEAASLQNKFWEMHELLFQNQAYLSGKDLFAYAKQIGLDMDRFRHDVQSQAVAARIEADLESGLRSRVNGTPTFYVNGKKFDGDWEDGGLIQDLKDLVYNQG